MIKQFLLSLLFLGLWAEGALITEGFSSSASLEILLPDEPEKNLKLKSYVLPLGLKDTLRTLKSQGVKNIVMYTPEPLEQNSINFLFLLKNFSKSFNSLYVCTPHYILQYVQDQKVILPTCPGQRLYIFGFPKAYVTSRGIQGQVGLNPELSEFYVKTKPAIRDIVSSKITLNVSGNAIIARPLEFNHSKANL